MAWHESAIPPFMLATSHGSLSSPALWFALMAGPPAGARQSLSLPVLFVLVHHYSDCRSASDSSRVRLSVWGMIEPYVNTISVSQNRTFGASLAWPGKAGLFNSLSRLKIKPYLAWQSALTGTHRQGKGQWKLHTAARRDTLHVSSEGFLVESAVLKKKRKEKKIIVLVSVWNCFIFRSKTSVLQHNNNDQALEVSMSMVC